MNIEIELAVVACLVTFLFGWICSEAYQFYKNTKERRWHRED